MRVWKQKENLWGPQERPKMQSRWHSYTSTPTLKARHAPNIQARTVSFAAVEGNVSPSDVALLVFVYTLHRKPCLSASYRGCITWQCPGLQFRFELTLATCNLLWQQETNDEISTRLVPSHAEDQVSTNFCYNWDQLFVSTLIGWRHHQATKVLTSAYKVGP